MRNWLLPTLLLLGCARAEPAAAQEARALAPFRSVALSDGGEVLVRHGPAQQVRLAAGDADLSVEGERLRIAHCRVCPRRERLRVEIVTPALESLSVEHGGRILLIGAFPAQNALAVGVAHGGAIDARPLRAETVAVSVNQGGMAYVRPGARLDAAVSQGGLITYWGTPEVRASNYRSGGVVRGRDEDLERPLRDLSPVPPPHVPPVKPVGG